MRWPRVSLVMPVRNEERMLESAMRSKLGNTYPELELVLVNDRSTDATGTLADHFSQTEVLLPVEAAGIEPAAGGVRRVPR